MKQLPKTEYAIVLRTDFSNQATWEKICEEIRRPSEEGFEAYVGFVDDRAFEGFTKKQIQAAMPDDFLHTFIIVIDSTSISDNESTLSVINLQDDFEAEIGAEFRALPSTIQAIENNLSIANMGFEDFLNTLDDNGIFRGF